MTSDEKQALKRTAGEAEVAKAISAMDQPDREISERLHKLIMLSAPKLLPRTWYGMPAYSNGDKIVLFFRSRKKFGERYMTVGFNDIAKLDDGNLWPTYYALTDMTSNEEDRLSELVKKAVS